MSASLYGWARCSHEGIGMPGCLTCDPSKERCVARAVCVEREGCAKVAEQAPIVFGCDGGATQALANDIAAAIRAREP